MLETNENKPEVDLQKCKKSQISICLVLLK